LYWIGLEDEFSAMIWNLWQLKHVWEVNKSIDTTYIIPETTEPAAKVNAG
jgi:hypothetical protein